MSAVIKLIGLANGRPTHHDGRYLVDADIETGSMLPVVSTTSHIEQALRFDNFDSAIEYWKRQAQGRRIRPDGKPNRPLTVYTVEVVEFDEGGTHADAPAGHTNG